MPRVRVPLVFTPTWEGPIKKWASNFIRKNRWRCDGIHEFDDLLQDAYLIYARVAEKYPRVVEASQFMALFKVAMQNRFHDHARYSRRKHEQVVTTPLDVTDFYAGRIGEVTNNGYLNALIAEAPDEVRYALAALNDPAKCAALREPRPRQRNKLRLRENLNMQLCRVTGAPRGTDLVGAIKALLT